MDKCMTHKAHGRGRKKHIQCFFNEKFISWVPGEQDVIIAFSHSSAVYSNNVFLMMFFICPDEAFINFQGNQETPLSPPLQLLIFEEQCICMTMPFHEFPTLYKWKVDVNPFGMCITFISIHNTYECYRFVLSTIN